MIERDIIMRMVQQLAAAIAKVLVHKDLEQYDEAFKEIDDACRGLIGMKWDFLRTFSDDQLSALLTVSEHPAKALAACELLREGSALLALQGKSEESLQQALKAFSLCVELLSQDRRMLKFAPVEKYSALLAGLEGVELPVAIEKKRFQFYEMTGELAKARAALNGVVAKEPAFRKEEPGFYHRLEKASDEDLLKGGLTRQDVLDGLASLKVPRRRGH